MLRIEATATGSSELFALEGRLAGAWVEALRRAVADALERGRRIELDLSALHFADAAGAELLRDLIGRGARVKKSSSFITQLLQPRDR